MPKFDTFRFTAKTAAGEWSPVEVNYAAYNYYSLQINITGSPTTVRVKLHGSIDRTNYSFFLDYTPTPAEIADGTVIVIPQTLITVNSIKPELVTLTGGSSPTVELWLKCKED